ncbi:MAG: RidA family protein [Paracoccaceae bacterium]
MTINRIRSGGPFEEKIGYARAVVTNGWVHVAGTVGTGQTVTEQCTSALGIIETALVEAGSSFADVVRVTYMLPNRHEFQECWPVLSKTFGDNPPAATMIECGLIDPKFKIEIEVTAVVSTSAD